MILKRSIRQSLQEFCSHQSTAFSSKELQRQKICFLQFSKKFLTTAQTPRLSKRQHSSTDCSALTSNWQKKLQLKARQNLKSFLKTVMMKCVKGFSGSSTHSQWFTKNRQRDSWKRQNWSTLWRSRRKTFQIVRGANVSLPTRSSCLKKNLRRIRLRTFLAWVMRALLTRHRRQINQLESKTYSDLERLSRLRNRQCSNRMCLTDMGPRYSSKWHSNNRKNLQLALKTSLERSFNPKLNIQVQRLTVLAGLADLDNRLQYK